jgi:hypothetical protein
MNQLNQTVSNLILDGLNRMLAGAPGATATPSTTPSKRHHRGECECEDCRDCERDDCFCRCCIGDADLVVYARLGERRVVPIVIENERRREKTIHLDFSGFKSRGGDPAGITSTLTPNEDFTLPPCAERPVVLVIEIPATGFSTSANEARTDVDECRVLYGDLRVEGCDIRPVRIALAILPRDCDAYEIECGCSCC